MRIHRHELEIVDYQTISTTGELLSVAQSRTQPNTLIDLWSLSHPNNFPTSKGLYIVGTGNPMPDQLESEEERFQRGAPSLPGHWRKFIGTVVTPSGPVCTCT